MKRRALVAAIAFLLLPFSAQALVEVGVRGGYWLPSLSGDLSADFGGFEAEGDLKDDIGFDNEGVPFAEAFFSLGDNHLSLSAAKVGYSGGEGGVDSSLDYVMLDAAYQWDALDLENVLAGFSLGPILQVKYLDGQLEGDTELEGFETSESLSFRAPMPMIGLGAHVGILADILEARVRAVGMAYAGNRILDLQGEVSWNILPFIELSGGYRYFAIDVDAEDLLGGKGELKLDYTQAGPYAALAVKLGL